MDLELSAVERAFLGITSVFQNPRDGMSLRGFLESIHHEAAQKAWRAAMAAAPSEALLKAAKNATPYGAYDQDAILVPVDPTVQWVEDQVHCRATILDTDSVRALCQCDEPWLFLNITLVTRDGQQHLVHVPDTLSPWPPTREKAETIVRDQVFAILGLKV